MGFEKTGRVEDEGVCVYVSERSETKERIPLPLHHEDNSVYKD